jgi:hypothetical protein
MNDKILNEEQVAGIVGGTEQENPGKTISNPMQYVCDNYFTRPGLYADPSRAPKECRYCFHLKTDIINAKPAYRCENVLNFRYV